MHPTYCSGTLSGSMNRGEWAVLLLLVRPFKVEILCPIDTIDNSGIRTVCVVSEADILTMLAVEAQIVDLTFIFRVTIRSIK